MTLSAHDNSSPLMLWCSSHSTLAAEEIPMLLQAGFRVIPLLTDFWTYKYNPDIDRQICDQWKGSVGLPRDIVQRLQALTICESEGQSEFAADQLRLLNEHVDCLYVTVLPNLALRLARVFRGTVMFRPFGHGDLNTYTRIAQHYRADLDSLAHLPNYMWVPILTTLSEPEDPRLTRNAHHLGAFVSPERLGPVRWSAESSQPYVVETIPRIQKQQYYLDMYRQYREDHGQLPLKILGGNAPGGGELNDPSIVGFLPDAEYHATAARARVSIYHGKSRFHVHYHPIEYMALGVPVLFHIDSAFAVEGHHYGLDYNQLKEAGMYESVEEANEMASAALADAQVAAAWSQRQRFFLNEVFSRAKVLDQARWLKRRVEQLKPWLRSDQFAQQQMRLAAVLPASDVNSAVGVVKAKRPIPERVYRELKRVVRRTVARPAVSDTQNPV